MTEYLCVQTWSKPGESESAFKARLSAFWTHMLRNRPDEFEKVYAETTSFTPKGNRLGRQYLFEVEILDFLIAEFRAQAVDFDTIDADEIYSKYEASPPGWFQIEH